MKHKILGLALLTLPLVSCNDFLTREPFDRLRGDNEETWNSEDVIKYSMYNVYPSFFKGFNSGWGRSDWFAETDIADWNDDNAQEVATFFTKNVPTATTAATQWNFENVRTLNTYLSKLSRSTILDEAKRHWIGVNRFLRAVEYAKLVSNFGDVPYYQEPIDPKDKDMLYRAFSPRLEVMDSVLSDMKYAMENVRISDGEQGLNITRDLVYAYASRI
ncbi:RagB/SusD family nutrient uptake outer membrane protein, partial [Prevotella aurantiaca]